jgi:hypothetical protein
MSFGYSIGDITALGKLAWTVYKSCRDAPESFKNVSQEAMSLQSLLMEKLSVETLSPTSQARLKTIGDGCRNVLEELQSLVDKYESLGTQSKRTWDRMKWAHNDIAELRSRLSSNTILLSAFIRYDSYLLSTKYGVAYALEYTNINQHDSSCRREKTWQTLAEFPRRKIRRFGRHSFDSRVPFYWRKGKMAYYSEELEETGITVEAFDANRDFIMDWFKTTVASGGFEEQTLEDTSSTQSCEEQTSEDTLSTCEEDLDSRYPTDGRSDTELPDPPTIRNTAIQNPFTLEAQSTQEVTQKAISSSPVVLPAGELRDTAKALRMPQKAPTRGGRVTSAATLFARASRHDRELINAASLGQKDVVRLLLGEGEGRHGVGVGS